MDQPIKINSREFRLMQEYIEQTCGIHLTDQKKYLVDARLTTIMVESGCDSFTELYHKAVADTSHKLRDRIIEAITTNETSWFRDSSPFSILDELLLEHYATEIQSKKRSKIKVWCAGCSTGQEPYSIAMRVLEFVRNHYSLRPEHVEIIGTDISSTVLYLAKAGRYDGLAMSRGLPEHLRNQYFQADGRVWVINDDVKKMVEYRKLNLQEDFSFLGKQDIIFCRNVLIYFSTEFKMDILQRITSLLSPNGYLFVGASETLFNDSNAYQMLRHGTGLYYKVK